MSASSYYNAVQGYNKLPAQGPEPYAPDHNAPFIAQEPYGSSKNFYNRNKSGLAKWGRRLRILRIVSSVFTAIFTCFMEGVMAYMLYKYFSTRNHQVNGRNAWANNTKLWPTWLLFVASGITVAITFISLCLYCCSKKASNSRRLWLTVAKYSVHIFSWLAVSIFYRVGKTGDDLWGWSCSQKAAAIQSEFPDIDFQKLCNIQVCTNGVDDCLRR